MVFALRIAVIEQLTGINSSIEQFLLILQTKKSVAKLKHLMYVSLFMFLLALF